MGIFSSIFGRKKDSLNNNVDDNPWAGLSSYEDPEKAEREGRKPKLFCGRDEESHNVAQLIAGNIFVTLYGKSGTGKTSLLNAGVFPQLRQKRYLPLSIRLSMDAMDISFQQCIIHQLKQAINNKQGTLETINVVALPEDELQPDYLWSFFARSRFLDSDGRILFPVIVFDQFEEVFRDRRDEAEVLLRQIAYIMDESHALSSRIVDGQPYKYDFNFRFAASIREDDLYRLEDSIDNCYLPELKRCRYRLRSLSEQGAKDVILIPGEGLFKTEEQKNITDKIIDKSRNEDGSISTNIISLLCSRIFVDFKRSGANNITPSLVDSFLKGNPFEKFYNEATRGFSNKEKNYIEDHLIDSSGRRNSIPESDFLLHVPKGHSLINGETRLLQYTSTSSDGKNLRIELIHDSFCEPLVGQKAKREKRKRIKYWAGTIGALCIAIGIILFIYVQMLKVERLNWKEMETNSRFLAEKATALVEAGDSYAARLILQEIITPDRPFIPETEKVLREAMKYDCTFINSDSSEFSDIYFSHDGKYLITDGLGCNYLIDVLTGKIVQTLSEGAIGPQPFINQGKQFLTSSNRKVYINDFATREKVDSIETLNYTFRSFSFSPDGKRFVTTAYDKKLRIYDTATRKCLHSIWVPSEQQEACFSPDGRQVLSFSYKGAYVWNAETGEKLFDFPQCDIIESAKYNSDGSRILLTDEYAIYNIDAETGGVLGIIDRTKDYWVEKQNFGRWMEAIWDHSSLIALAKKDWIISVWDLATDDYIQLLNTDVNAKNIKRFIFSPNSKSIAAISGIHTIYLWGTYPNDIYCMRHKISVDGNLYRGLASFYNGGNFAVTNENGRISIWNVKTGEHIRTFGDSATVVSISSDDTYVSTGSYNGIISIWDVNTGELIRSFKGYSKAIQSILFSYDNQHLATTIDGNGFDKEKKICIWEVGSGKCIGKYDYSVDTTPLYAGQLIDISPDGKYMAIAGFFDIKLHNLKTNECVKAGLKHDALVNSVCFSPDGKYLVSASYDKSVRVWDLSSLRCIHLLVGHDKNVCTAKYSPDGKYIISASDDEIVRIWDAETGKCIERLYGHNGRVLSAAFSSDGKNVVTISNDSTIKVWDFPTLQQLIDETRERFKDRQLTPEERRKYYLE